MSEKTKQTRTRNWSVILYPESAPENWREILDDLHIEWVESPLHDRDLTGAGEPKKPHIHLLLMFGGVKTYEQIKDITESINCPSPQKCHNAKALVRYMVHMDDANKAQYDQSKIIAHGGVDLFELLRPSSSERYSLIKEMQAYIRENLVTEFSDFMDYACEEHFDDWYPLLCDNSAFVIGNYIKSKRHKFDRLKAQGIDISTGEIIEGYKGGEND